MKRSELLGKLADVKKYGKRALIPYLAVLIAFAAMTWWFAASNQQNENPRLPAMMMLGFLVLVYGGLFPTALLVRRFRRRAGLQCPGCKKDLMGVNAQIVVAAGRCGLCGTVIVDEE